MGACPDVNRDLKAIAVKGLGVFNGGLGDSIKGAKDEVKVVVGEIYTSSGT
jgi:hypothetical protein